MFEMSQQRLSFLIFFLALLSGFLYNHQYFINGTHVPVRIHDHLEQAPMARTHIYHESNFFWRNGESSPRLLDGNYFEPTGPRIAMQNFAYYYLDAFTAYLVTDTLARILAFVGMFLWLRRLLKKDNRLMLVAMAISAIYSFLPFYHPHIFTITLLPITAWLFMVFYAGDGKARHWVILLVLPFFTAYFFAPFFLLTIIFLVYLFYFLKTKKIHRQFLLAFVLLNLVYMLTEYRFFYVAFFSDEITHRVVRQEVSYGLVESLSNAFKNFEFGHHHVPTLHRVNYSIALVLVAIQFIFFRLRGEALGFYRENKRLLVLFFLTLNLTALVSLFFGIADWNVFKNIHESIPVVGMVNIKRFHWLHPLLWYTVWALLVAVVYGILLKKKRAYALAFLVLFTFFHTRFLFDNAAWSGNPSITHGNQTYRNLPTLEQFFAPRQFEQIRDFIGKPQDEYRVVSFGLHPSIALYNGFYCLDGYRSNFYFSYHQQFREIIAPALEKNEELRIYYDNRGNRCYLIDDELNQSFFHWRNHEFTDRSIRNLTVNVDKLYDMGGRYVISAVRIREPGLWLRLLNVFEQDPPEHTNWTIYLYEVVPLHLYPGLKKEREREIKSERRALQNF